MSVDLNNGLQNINENITDTTSLNELNDAIAFYNPKEVYYGMNYDFTEKYNILKDIKTAKIYKKGNIIVSLNNNIYSFSKPYDDTKNSSIGPVNLISDKCKILYIQYYYVQKCYNLMVSYSKKK